MKRAASSTTLLGILIALTICGCAAQNGRGMNSGEESARVNNLVSQIQIGSSQTHVEKILGSPYSTETTGSRKVLTYVSDSQYDDGSGSQQKTQAGLTLVTSLLSAASSLGGGSFGSVGTIGSQVSGVGGTLNQPNYQNAPSSNQKTTVQVVLEKGKVISVSQESAGRVGIGY